MMKLLYSEVEGRVLACQAGEPPAAQAAPAEGLRWKQTKHELNEMMRCLYVMY